MTCRQAYVRQLWWHSSSMLQAGQQRAASCSCEALLLPRHAHRRHVHIFQVATCLVAHTWLIGDALYRCSDCSSSCCCYAPLQQGQPSSRQTICLPPRSALNLSMMIASLWQLGGGWQRTRARHGVVLTYSQLSAIRANTQPSSDGVQPG